MDYNPWFEYLDYDENAIYVKAKTGVGEDGKGSVSLTFNLKTSEGDLPPQTLGATIKQTLSYTGKSSVDGFLFDDFKYKAILTGIQAANAAGLDNVQQLTLQLSAENAWNQGPFSATLENYLKTTFDNNLGADNISITFGTKGTFTYKLNLGDLAVLSVNGNAELIYIPMSNNQVFWTGAGARLENVDTGSGTLDVIFEALRVGYRSTNGGASASGEDERILSFGFEFSK